jgi:predicted membrane protein
MKLRSDSVALAVLLCFVLFWDYNNHADLYTAMMQYLQAAK